MHLSYADDKMLYYGGNVKSTLTIIDLISKFEKISDISSNALKSAMIFGGGTNLERNEFFRLWVFFLVTQLSHTWAFL